MQCYVYKTITLPIPTEITIEFVFLRSSTLNSTQVVIVLLKTKEEVIVSDVMEVLKTCQKDAQDEMCHIHTLILMKHVHPSTSAPAHVTKGSLTKHNSQSLSS